MHYYYVVDTNRFYRNRFKLVTTLMIQK